MDGSDLTWQDQWRTVMRGFLVIGRCYSGQHVDPSPEQVVHDFCRECSQLSDSLESDSTIPPAVQLDVTRHVAASRSITLAYLVAHPRYVGETTIHAVAEHNPPRTLLRIEWKNADGTTESDDALDLASGAIAEWRRFLSRHNLAN